MIQSGDAILTGSDTKGTGHALIGFWRDMAALVAADASHQNPVTPAPSPAAICILRTAFEHTLRESLTMRSEKIIFPGSQGEPLAARLDFPDGAVRACALFAHCFTCSEETLAAARIAGALAEKGAANPFMILPAF